MMWLTVWDAVQSWSAHVRDFLNCGFISATWWAASERSKAQKAEKGKGVTKHVFKIALIFTAAPPRVGGKCAFYFTAFIGQLSLLVIKRVGLLYDCFLHGKSVARSVKPSQFWRLSLQLPANLHRVFHHLPTHCFGFTTTLLFWFTSAAFIRVAFGCSCSQWTSWDKPAARNLPASANNRQRWRLAGEHSGGFSCWKSQVFLQELVETKTKGKRGWMLDIYSPGHQRHDSKWLNHCYFFFFFTCTSIFT